MKTILYTGLAGAALIFAGCGQTAADSSNSANAGKTETATEMAGAPEHDKTTAEDIGNRGEVMMAIQNLDRSAKDKADDEARKPAQVLEFTGVWPGMSVIEMEAGSGYYTELLSRVVGPEGKVIHQNPAAFDAFLPPETVEARFGADGTRLSNVGRIKTNFDNLAAEDNNADMVTWFLGPHELFYTPDDGNTFGTPADTYAEIFRVLKPGGKFIVLDHAAAAGSPETTGNSTHRIDPATVRAHAENAGFVFSKSSDVLANADDDYTVNVFDPAVRRKTDRFLHMYVKPE